jgi:hypothetical protein
MPDMTLTTPLLAVSLEDGRQLQVRVVNPDFLAWDRTAAKHGWPSMRTAPFLWMTFLAWSALRRTGQLGGDVTWEAFSEQLCVQVSTADGEAATNGHVPDDLLASFLGPDAELAAPAEVGPTNQAPGRS